MKKLVLHSDQIAGKTQVDEASMELFPSDRPKIAYIPSRSDVERKYFSQKVAWYKQFGITDLLYFDTDQGYEKRRINELLLCDGIFLSGGDTYYFLNSLQKRNLLPILREYVGRGGVLIGVSAGSIIMSPTIDITTLHGLDTIGLKDYSALGLVNFDFFPHLDHCEKEYLEKIIEYSKTSNSVIYACRDGDGIIVNEGHVEFFGEIQRIENGLVTTV